MVKGEYFTQISVNMFSVVLDNTVYSMSINKHQAFMKNFKKYVSMNRTQCVTILREQLFWCKPSQQGKTWPEGIDWRNSGAD